MTTLAQLKTDETFVFTGTNEARALGIFRVLHHEGERTLVECVRTEVLTKNCTVLVCSTSSVESCATPHPAQR